MTTTTAPAPTPARPPVPKGRVRLADLNGTNVIVDDELGERLCASGKYRRVA